MRDCFYCYYELEIACGYDVYSLQGICNIVDISSVLSLIKVQNGKFAKGYPFDNTNIYSRCTAVYIRKHYHINMEFFVSILSEYHLLTELDTLLNKMVLKRNTF